MNMRTIKKGDKLRHNADDITILDRREYLILAKIEGNSGTFYDISRPFVDSSGNEDFMPSPNGNGLTEIVPGGQKVPKTLDVMTVKFNELVEGIETSRRSTAESLQRNEQRIATRAQRAQYVKNLRDDLRTELAALVNGDKAKPIETVLTTKKAQSLAAQIMTSEQILTIIR